MEAGERSSKPQGLESEPEEQGERKMEVYSCLPQVTRGVVAENAGPPPQFIEAVISKTLALPSTTTIKKSEPARQKRGGGAETRESALLRQYVQVLTAEQGVDVAMVAVTNVLREMESETSVDLRGKEIRGCVLISFCVCSFAVRVVEKENHAEIETKRLSVDGAAYMKFYRQMVALLATRLTLVSPPSTKPVIMPEVDLSALRGPATAMTTALRIQLFETNLARASHAHAKIAAEGLHILCLLFDKELKAESCSAELSLTKVFKDSELLNVVAKALTHADAEVNLLGSALAVLLAEISQKKLGGGDTTETLTEKLKAPLLTLLRVRSNDLPFAAARRRVVHLLSLLPSLASAETLTLVSSDLLNCLSVENK